MKNRLKQLGQGMTEYIIIVALIAVAAITVYGFFGDTVRGQVTAMTLELGGKDGKDASAVASTAAGKADKANTSKTLETFADDANP